MKFTRSLFFFLLCAAVAIPVLAADNEATTSSSSVGQTSEALRGGFSAQVVPTPFGMIPVNPRPLSDSARPAPAQRFMADTGCLKLRMYKVKRTERLADGETASRGYTTCEWASNYQMRTAVAHTSEDGVNNPKK